MSTFEQFNLPKSLQKAVDLLGLINPTPIQIKSFPVILSGRDVMGIAQTGTGKTFAYLLPILKQWKFQDTETPRVVIIVPTRELVVQVAEEVQKLTQFMSVRTIGVFGGVNINTQKKAVLQGIDILIHVAWTTVPKDASENPAFDIQSNLEGGVNLLSAAVSAGVKKVIFISTGGTVYGIPKYIPIDENHPLNPISAYGISKMAFERYLHFFYNDRNLDYCVLRVSNAYGTRQNLFKNQGVIGHWLQKIKNNEKLTLIGDGEQVRDYIYATDVASAIAKSIDYLGSEKIFNLGYGKGNSLNEILKVCQEITQKEIQLVRLPSRNIDVNVNVLDNQLIQRELNWKPELDLNQGIQKVWDWFQEI